MRFKEEDDWPYLLAGVLWGILVAAAIILSLYIGGCL
jgi:hypothetical protein